METDQRHTGAESDNFATESIRPDDSRKIHRPSNPRYSSTLDRLELIQELQPYIADPEYRIIAMVRHAHAGEQDWKKTDLDHDRPIDERGFESIDELVAILSTLESEQDDTVVVTSKCLRVHGTAEPIADLFDAHFVEDESLYRQPMTDYLAHLKQDYSDTHLAFLVSHGKIPTREFLEISGRDGAFNPTAGIMFLAVKTPSWESLHSDTHEEVHMFTWAPSASSNSMLESVCVEEPDGDYTKESVSNLSFASSSQQS